MLEYVHLCVRAHGILAAEASQKRMMYAVLLLYVMNCNYIQIH